MKYVIKSKNRINKLNTHTLKLLRDYGIDDNDIFIFVSSEIDKLNYKEAFPNINIILGDKGIVGIDNFIVDYFDEGEEYIYMNDDIKSIHYLNLIDDKPKLKKCDTDEFNILVDKLFSELRVHKLSYGGIYVCPNVLFMDRQPQITFDLCIIIDGFSACINNKNIILTKFDGINDNWLSDYEKSILHFKDRGGNIRLNKYCFKGEFFGKDIEQRNKDNHLICATAMKDKYNDYISSVKKKKDGWNSLRFKKIKNSVI